MAASAQTHTGPGAQRRLVGVDVARCLALLGMVAVHVLDERTPTGEVAAMQWLAGGRASALFATLAGVSLALTTGRRLPERGRELGRSTAGVAVRGGLVALIGLALGGLDSGLAVILTYYGVLFWLGLPFLGMRARPLLVLAAAWAVLAPVVSQLVRPQLPPRRFASPSFEQLGEPGRLVAELLFTGYYPAFCWLAYLLLGLGVGRLALERRAVAGWLAGGGLVVAVAATVLSGVLSRAAGLTEQQLDRVATGMAGQTPTDDWSWLLVVAPHSTTPFDLVQTGGSAALVLGLCLLLASAAEKVVPGSVGRRALAVGFGAGTMTLSLYSLHVVMRTEPVWPEEEPGSFVLHVVVLLWVGAMHATLGLRGPLEWFVGRVAGAVRR